MLERGKEDGDRGNEGGYQPVYYPESDMKETEEQVVDHHGTEDD